MAKIERADVKRWLEQGAERARAGLVLPWVWIPLVFLTAAAVGFGWGAWRNLCIDCPSIAQIHTWEPQQTSKLYSHDGRLIGELGVQRRTPVSIHALPDHVPQAFIAIEDRRFYEHDGVDFRGVTRAAIGVLTSGSFRGGGGSTITQQLARNMFETIGFEKRVERKLKELQVALELERAYSKDQILEAYMNQINLAHGWWGIHTAARNFFGKEAFEMNPAEAALLAAIANRPAVYSPFGRDPDAGLRRRNLVLDLMVREGFLTRDEARTWKQHPLPAERAEVTEGLGPYFQEWVRQILFERFPGQVNTGGLRVYTTLDADMQRAAEASMQAGFDSIESRPGFPHPLYEEYAGQNTAFEGSESPYLQGAMIVLDPATGAVRALVGGRDYQQSRFNRAVQARRQPGSSFKTFAFASAIANGIPASHVMTDAPVVRTEWDGTEWRPTNFGGEFHGDMTLREAFRRSINMVAIRLADEVSIETVAQTARQLGIASTLPRVPSLAIGSADVLPIEMAEAYSAFANMGTRVRPYPILRVENAEGEVLWDPQPQRARVLEPLPTRVMVSLMEDVVRPGGTAYTGVRIRGRLPEEVPAAGKTGTTNNSTDVWFVGFTPTLQAAVWFGMDRPSTVYPGATGGGDAAPVWGDFMRRVYIGEQGADDEDAATDPENEATDGTADEAQARGPILPIPDPWSTEGLITREVDSLTGLLASPWCPVERRYTELFIPGTEPTEECDVSRDIRTVPW